MNILGPDPTPGTPFLRSDCDGRCANYQGGDFQRARHTGGGAAHHHHHHHHHGHGHSHESQHKLNRAPTMGEMAPRTSTPTVGEAAVPRIDLPPTPAAAMPPPSSTRSLTSNSISKRLTHVTKRDGRNQFDDCDDTSDAIHAVSIRKDISETDLARIRRALDLDDPKRTDYTYSFSQTYHQRPPTPRWENPRMCRPSLHGPHDNTYRSISFDESFSGSTVEKFFAWLKSFFEQTTTTTTTTTETTDWSSSSPSGGQMVNGGTKAKSAKRISSRLHEQQQQKDAMTSLANGRLHTGERQGDAFAFDDSSSSTVSTVDVSARDDARHQFWLWRTFCSTITDTVTTTFDTLTYPARRLMQDVHERRRRGRGCGGLCCWWLPLLLLLLLLLPACLLLCRNDEYKENARRFVNARVTPLPLALWKNSRDALVRSQNAVHGYWSGMDLSGFSWPVQKAREYWSEWWPIIVGWVSYSRSVPEEVREKTVVPPVALKEGGNERESVVLLGAAEREELDRLRATVDQLRAEVAGFTHRCCKQPNLAAYLTRSDAEQLFSDQSAKLAALGAELRLIDERHAGGLKSSSAIIDRLEKNIATLGAELLALTNRLSSTDSQTAAIVAGLAASEQKLHEFRESQRERETIILAQVQKALVADTAGEKVSKQQAEVVLSADVKAQLAQLTAMTAQLAAFDQQLAHLRARDERHDAYEAEIAALRTELDQKMGGLNGEWRRDLAAAIGALDLGKEDLVLLKARLETIEKKSLETSHNVAVDLSVDLEEVKRLIKLAINRYDADKTGLADYALESAGGSIVSIRCSRTHSPKTRKESIFGIPLWYANYGPRTVIQRKAQGTIPGE
uniref:SUN domain-containing protein n=1 Tax=Plectus sambesii TaxID=2011161 RepID=A0A914XK63_9BILA